MLWSWIKVKLKRVFCHRSLRTLLNNCSPSFGGSLKILVFFWHWSPRSDPWIIAKQHNPLPKTHSISSVMIQLYYINGITTSSHRLHVQIVTAVACCEATLLAIIVSMLHFQEAFNPSSKSPIWSNIWAARSFKARRKTAFLPPSIKTDHMHAEQFKINATDCWEAVRKAASTQSVQIWTQDAAW